jgi:flagellin-like hook-associated protein FlgL
MSELSYTLSAVNNTTVTLKRQIGGGPPAAVGTYTGQDLQSLASAISLQISADINGTQVAAKSANPLLKPGEISASAQATIPPLASGAFDATGVKDPLRLRALYSPEADLVAEISYAGGAYAAVSFAPVDPPLAHDATLTDIARVLTNNIKQQLATAQYAATHAPNGWDGVGRILKGPADPHGGPALTSQIEGLSTEDLWKDGSAEKTVSKQGIIDKTKYAYLVASAGTPLLDSSGFSNFGARALASAINHNADSQFWAMVQPFDSQGNPADMVYVFAKAGGDLNSILACDVADGDEASRRALDALMFENVADNKINQSGSNLTLGGEYWGRFKPVQTRAVMGTEVWNLTLNGRDVGRERDLWIAAVTSGANEIVTPGLNAGIINGLDRYSFVELQNAADGSWAGAEVRTQSSAQEALDALTAAMERKDKVRADLGALQNRLENTMTNLEIQMEALQASESRISDVDVATEMTEFVRNQVLSQAAVSMLSQANSLPQLALSLISG